jgi:hypothetical protein
VYQYLSSEHINHRQEQCISLGSVDVDVLIVHAKVSERFFRFNLPDAYKLPWNTNQANSAVEQ